MTQYTWADGRHETDIVRLWKQGFPQDTEEDIRTFLRTFRRDARCLLLEEDNTVCSMAFLIPAVMVHSGAERPLWYVYAATTATERRGEGLFSQLLEEIARRACDENVYGLFLRPGTPSLFSYYERHGFQTTFFTEEFSCKAKQLCSNNETVVWQSVTSHHAVCRQYWLSLCGVPHILWSQPATAYAVDLLEKGGMVASTKGMAMYRRENDTLIVTELLCKPQDRETVLYSLARHFTCQKITVVLPPTAAKNARPYGMFRAVAATDTADGGWYMGFSLE